MDFLVIADKLELDKLDLKILGYLREGKESAEMSVLTKTARSTINKRLKRLKDGELARPSWLINYRKMNFKIQMLHIYLGQSDARSVIHKLLKMKGVLSVSRHHGNSDVIAEFVYKDTSQLVNAEETIKSWPEVSGVKSSEQVSHRYTHPSNTDLHALLSMPKADYDKEFNNLD